MIKTGDRVTPINDIINYNNKEILKPGEFYTIAACNGSHCMLNVKNSPIFELKLFRKIFDRNDVIERIINVKSISGEFAKDIASEIRIEMERELPLL